MAVIKEKNTIHRRIFRLRKKLLSRAKSERGASLIEMVFALPIFLMFIGGIIEMGLIVWGNSLLDNMLLQSSRLSQVGCVRSCYDNNGNLDTSRVVTVNEIRQLIGNKARGFISADRLCYTAAVMEPNNMITVGLGEPNDVVTFSMRYQWPTYVPITRAFNLFAVDEQSTILNYVGVNIVRNEDYPDLTVINDLRRDSAISTQGCTTF